MHPVPSIESLLAQADAGRMRRELFCLSKDPLPFRKANFTRAGETKTTLEETDEFVAGTLGELGYLVTREAVPVQAFRCDTSKPPSHWYAAPEPGDPWYEGVNLYAELPGTVCPERTTLLIAHKDSPSWIDCPGAVDNAAGTVCQLEVARLLAGQRLRGRVRFLFCNEEHWPWTSLTAAAKAAARGEELAAILNLDGCGYTSPEEQAAGHFECLAVYGTPEGKRLAEVLAGVSESYRLGVTVRQQFRAEPENDDGSFLKAGFPAALGVHGSPAYEDPFYHRPEDVPERLDPESLRRVAQLVTAAVLALDRE